MCADNPPGITTTSVRFNVDIPAGEIDFDNKVTQSSVLLAEGVAELVSHTLGDIRLRGNLQVTVAAPVTDAWSRSRCQFRTPFDLVYIPASEATEGGEEEIDDAAVEVGFYEGNGVATERCVAGSGFARVADAIGLQREL